jgi:protein-tyrosine phosphatase
LDFLGCDPKIAIARRREFGIIAAHSHPTMKSDRQPIRVLFVCMGNICRSPAGENIFCKLVADAGRATDFEIDSAGTIGFHEGSPPDPRMVAALRERGYPASGRARQIRPADLEKFDLIVTMDEENLANVRRLDAKGLHHGKIRPLVGFCTFHQAPRVPDPYYGGQRGFDEVIDLIEDGCSGILREF